MLLFFNGRKSPKVIDYDFDLNAMLLEKITPGSNLKFFFPSQDKKSIEIFIKIIKELHHPIDNNNKFPQINDWLKNLEYTSEVPESHRMEALKLGNNLINTQGEKMLLHGDLSHYNILQSGDEFITIDPKGVIGESTYEIGCFIRNPIEELLQLDNPEEIIRQRILYFSSLLDIDKQRIKDWSYVQAILLVLWSKGGRVLFLRIADLLKSIYF